jgi:hypothetical protein
MCEINYTYSAKKVVSFVINSLLESSRYFTILEASVATCRPWKRAASSSFSEGYRSPAVPAIVEEPYGEPPVISSSLDWPVNV